MGFKKLLVSKEWGFAKRSVKYDGESLTMNVANKPVVKVGVVNDKLSMDWQDQSWAEWQELVGAVEFTSLIEKGNTLLKNAKDLQAKGMGKGKPST